MLSGPGHLEDGDHVVVDHVGAAEGLGREQEHHHRHGVECGPAGQAPAAGRLPAALPGNVLQLLQLPLHTLATLPLSQICQGLETKFCLPSVNSTWHG